MAVSVILTALGKTSFDLEDLPRPHLLLVNKEVLPPTLSAWASRDFEPEKIVLSSSSNSRHLLQIKGQRGQRSAVRFCHLNCVCAFVLECVCHEVAAAAEEVGGGAEETPQH